MIPTLKLSLHAGSREVPLSAVRAVPTPQATASWQPVAHAEYLRTVRSSFDAAGFEIIEESHALWGGGARYFGFAGVRSVGHQPDGTTRSLYA